MQFLHFGRVGKDCSCHSSYNTAYKLLASHVGQPDHTAENILRHLLVALHGPHISYPFIINTHSKRRIGHQSLKTDVLYNLKLPKILLTSLSTYAEIVAERNIFGQSTVDKLSHTVLYLGLKVLPHVVMVCASSKTIHSSLFSLTNSSIFSLSGSASSRHSGVTKITR